MILIRIWMIDNHSIPFIYFIFLIIWGSLSLSHCARFIRSCIFSSVSFNILANSADISSIFFFSSFIQASLLRSFSYCSFFVWFIMSLFFSFFMQICTQLIVTNSYCCYQLVQFILILLLHLLVLMSHSCSEWAIFYVIVMSFYFQDLRSLYRYITLYLT